MRASATHYVGQSFSFFWAITVALKIRVYINMRALTVSSTTHIAHISLAAVLMTPTGGPDPPSSSPARGHDHTVNDDLIICLSCVLFVNRIRRLHVMRLTNIYRTRFNILINNDSRMKF